MNDASIVAGQIADVAQSIDDVALAIRGLPAPIVNVDLPSTFSPNVNVSMPEQAAPTVVVEIPPQNTPIVNVAAPDVTVQSNINVPPTEPVAYEVTVTQRDVNGMISKFVISPIQGK